MPPKTTTRSEQKSVRLSPETLSKAGEIARTYDTLSPPSLADVMTRAIDHLHEARCKAKKKS